MAGENETEGDVAAGVAAKQGRKVCGRVGRLSVSLRLAAFAKPPSV
jgi:hypothetical protein